MRDYLLFIDTETSGLPVNWNAPYQQKNNWPYAVQLSWIIYKTNREEVKREDHYIQDNDFNITPDALSIHGITREFLTINGKPRKEILTLLQQDLEQYEPLVIGHFMELDFHIIGAEFYRNSLNNPLNKLPVFCTMLATTNLFRNPQIKFLRLGNLYDVLFNKRLDRQHNALADALGTAACFFELVKRGEINDYKIDQQQKAFQKSKSGKKGGCAIPVLMICFLIILIIVYR